MIASRPGLGKDVRSRESRPLYRWQLYSYPNIVPPPEPVVLR